MSQSDVAKHVQQVADVLSSPEKGPPSQKRLHLLNYAATIAVRSDVANLLVQSPCLLALVKQIKDSSVPEL